MSGASLSRWTMSYFAAALLSLLLAQAAMVAGYGFPGDGIATPETLAVVHLVAIGWLSLLMCGALIQFVPVLVSAPLASPELPAIALVLLAAGLAGLVIGFLGMAGHSVGALPWLPLGAAGLACGFTLNLWNLASTLWTARPLATAPRFVAVGLASLVAVITLGTVFATVLGGWSTNSGLAWLTSDAVPIHAAAGLGGWLTFTAMGVSYRLFAMFMLAPETESRCSRVALLAGAAALLVLVVGGPTCILLGRSPLHALAAAAMLATASLACYGFDMVRLYRARKRRKLELNARVAAWALAALAMAAVLQAVLAAVGAVDQHAGALVFVFAFAWLSGLGLATLYKIVAFLTWLECYGSVLGRRPTPRVQDLVDERRALPWFRLYFASVAAAAAAAYVGAPLTFRLAAAGMFAASCRICVELWRIRTLRAVPEALLPPDGGPRRSLVLPTFHRFHP